MLFAPGVFEKQEKSTLLREIDRFVNVLIGLSGMTLSVGDLPQLGTRRVSVGGSLARAALGELMCAATELRDFLTMGYASGAMSGSLLNALYRSLPPEASVGAESGSRWCRTQSNDRY